MNGRAAITAGVLLVALVAVGGFAWTVSGATRSGVAPASAPPAVPDSGAGSGVVSVSAGAAEHPAAQLVLEQVQLYFNAVNGRDHATWTRVVSPETAGRETREAWLDGIGSTTDGTIRIDRIDPAPGGGVLALVRFVSVQAPDDGPPGLQVGRICWQVAYPMAGSPPRLGVGDPNGVLRAPC
ncbi:hypothetical protein [Pseudonocardia spirodelae]|uniref:Uncharacterized protein n=1 Tax=Pseudonocardia spirodelae TaxID=3133431 RepID=A0ABU8TAB7_9PSEU